jgi:purine nucleosidase
MIEGSLPSEMDKTGAGRQRPCHPDHAPDFSATLPKPAPAPSQLSPTKSAGAASAIKPRTAPIQSANSRQLCAIGVTRCHVWIPRRFAALVNRKQIQRTEPMPPRRIIIDTDPGQDDAVAILLALASPADVTVLGITAVAGNVPLALTERNARIICELAGRSDIPVFAGCDAPLVRKLVTAEHVHGKTGLDGPQMDAPVMPLQDQHGVDFIIDTLRTEPPGSVTLCALGPLTNIATAFQKAPDIIPRVQEIVLMGGAYFEVGNITPAAEFNIYVDPEAAKIVFGAGVKLTVMPLDVTHKALTNAARVQAFRDMGTRVGDMVAAWTDFFERFDKEKYGSEGAPLHDPCVIAYLIDPTLFTGRLVNVEIETVSDLTLGMTVADWWGVTKRPRNALFMGGVDAAGFYALLTERLALL